MLKPNGEEVVKKENYRYTKSFTKQNFPCHVVPTRPPSPASYYTAGCSGDIAVVLYPLSVGHNISRKIGWPLV